MEKALRPQSSGVQYGEARGRIETGDVFLFQGTSLVSRFIRWGSKSPYSHAGIALWWHHRLLVVQSAGRGVEILPASTAVRHYDGQVDWWQPDPELRAALKPKLDVLLNAAFDELGKPYAVWPLVALVARMFRGEEWGNPDQEKTANYFCSQLVSRCYRRAGLDLVPEKADHDTSPGDLARCGRLLLRAVLHHHPSGVPALALPALQPGSAAAALQHAAQVAAPPSQAAFPVDSAGSPEPPTPSLRR